MLASGRCPPDAGAVVLSGGIPQVIYWGAPLPKSDDLTVLARAQMADVTGGMLDANPDLSLCPEASRTFPGQPGLILRDTDGTPLLPCFKLAKVDAQALSLAITCEDADNALTWWAEITLDSDTHVLKLLSGISAERPLHLHWLAAPVLPGPQLSDEMIDVAGRWTGEFQLNRTPWSPGIRYRENRTGRTGHEHFPGLIVPDAAPPIPAEKPGHSITVGPVVTG